MNESKELLEATVKGLQEKIQSLQTDLNEKQKELNDINKPVMEAWMYDEIHGLVEDGVGDYDFSDADNYEFDPEFDYDNRIVIGFNAFVEGNFGSGYSDSLTLGKVNI